MSLTKIVVNCSTGETETIALTSAEIAQVEADWAAAETARQAAEAEASRIAALKVSAKAKLVAGTALTDEEAALLIG
jgi:hypothetical protein